MHSRQSLCLRRGVMDNQPKLFGKRVRTLRRAAKVTQEDAAERARLNPKYVGEIERGEKRPSFEAILALANALETSPAAFFQFDREEYDEKLLRKKLAALLNKCEGHELQHIFRIFKASVEHGVL